MRNTYPAGGFGGNNFGANNMEGMWQAVEELRSRFEKRSGTRAGRGEVRAAILSLLAERPMHGYQIIHEIDLRSGGSWKPSAGSVYPTLQLLADEGLIVAEESSGRKVFSLTDAGREDPAAAGHGTPWGTEGQAPSFSALPKAGVELAQAAAQVGRTGTPEQVQEAVKVLTDARRRLYSILAQD